MVVPASTASEQPSPSLSKSNLFGIPSLSESKSKKHDAYTANPPVPDAVVPPFILKLTSAIPIVLAPTISFKWTTPHDWVEPVFGTLVLK